LPDDPPPSGSDSSANRNFMGAGCALSDQKIRDVGASDQEQQSCRTQQDIKGGADIRSLFGLARTDTSTDRPENRPEFFTQGRV